MQPMTIDDIRNYIATHGYNYTWVAAQLHVSKYTVREWFSSRRPVPAHRLRELEELITNEMRRNVLPDPQVEHHIVAFTLTSDELAAVKIKSNKEEMTVEQYAKDVLLARIGYDRN